MKDLILKRISRQYSNMLNKVPITNIEKLNKEMEEQNLRYKLDIVNFQAFYDGVGVLALVVEDDKLYWVPALKVLETRVLYDTDIVMTRLLLRKIKGQTANTWRQEVLKYTKEKNGVLVRRFIERAGGKQDGDDIYKKLFKVSEIPVLLVKGDINGEILSSLLGLLLESSEVLYKRFIQESMLSGAKFVVKGQTVDNTYGTDSAAEKISKAILSGDSVIIQNNSYDSDTAVVESVGVTTNVLEFRNSLDWLVNKAIEYSGLPELNGGDKGTANLQTTEVVVNMASKMENLEKWKEVRTFEWKRFFKAYSQLTKTKLPQFELPIMDSQELLYDSEGEDEKSNPNARKSNNQNEEVDSE